MSIYIPVVDMPGMSGRDMLPNMRAARPDVPIIMIPAYGDLPSPHAAFAQQAETMRRTGVFSGEGQ